MRNCPCCGRPTQSRKRNQDGHIPGVVQAALKDGTCEGCRLKKLKARRMEPRVLDAAERERLRLENTRAGLDALMAARRRRRVPAGGWRVEGED